MLIRRQEPFQLFINAQFVDPRRSTKAQGGFSLLEVLVALAVISIFMLLVGPLSRQTTRMISSVESTLAAFAYQNANLAQAPAVLEFLNKTNPGFEMRMRDSRLAPFIYDPSVKAEWQPFLQSSEVTLPDGRRIGVERIVLKPPA